MGTFWDFCAPFYDLFEKTNWKAYSETLRTIRNLIPQGACVFEAAAGTGEISLAIADKASHILCTDLSSKMLDTAGRKIKKRRLSNITLDIRSIYELNEPDSSFDYVIAGMVFHLLDAPEKAAAELIRIAKSTVILPMVFTGDLHGISRLSIKVYRLFGFSPKIELTPDTCKSFLERIGFNGCELIHINGKIPMAVAVWKKALL